MKQHEAAAFLPLIKAWSEGGVLQELNLSREWEDLEEPEFCRHITNYRIKPEPKPPVYRPWKPEEVPPLGFIVRNTDTSNSWIGMATGKTNQQLCIIASYYSYDSCLRTMVYSLDHGKTWLPCGVLVTEEGE